MDASLSSRIQVTSVTGGKYEHSTKTIDQASNEVINNPLVQYMISEATKNSSSQRDFTYKITKNEDGEGTVIIRANGTEIEMEKFAGDHNNLQTYLQVSRLAEELLEDIHSGSAEDSGEGESKRGEDEIPCPAMGNAPTTSIPQPTPRPPLRPTTSESYPTTSPPQVAGTSPSTALKTADLELLEKLKEQNDLYKAVNQHLMSKLKTATAHMQTMGPKMAEIEKRNATLEEQLAVVEEELEYAEMLTENAERESAKASDLERSYKKQKKQDATRIGLLDAENSRLAAQARDLARELDDEKRAAHDKDLRMKQLEETLATNSLKQGLAPTTEQLTRLKEQTAELEADKERLKQLSDA